MKNPFRKKALAPREVFIRTYLDSIAPGVVKFEVDHYIFGNTYRCIWALREYPASTESQAILRHLGEKSGVTLRIYCRQVSPGEEDRSSIMPTRRTSWTVQTPTSCGKRWRPRATCGMWRSWCIKCTENMSRCSTALCIWR